MNKILIGLLSLALAGNAWADFQQGKAAFVARDYAKALKEFEPLAKEAGAIVEVDVATGKAVALERLLLPAPG